MRRENQYIFGLSLIPQQRLQQNPPARLIRRGAAMPGLTCGVHAAMQIREDA
jgi:hypothetical protein